MDTLLGHFRHLYQHDLRHGFQAMAQSCDELRHLVLFIHQIIAPSDHGRKESPSIAPENPFHNMFEDVSKASIDQQRYRTSTQMTVATGRGARYFLSSSSSNNQSSVPSFSCRQVNAMPPVVKSKVESQGIDDDLFIIISFVSYAFSVTIPWTRTIVLCMNW